jgi:tetratricopeptide (TPR) repeat protein
MSRANLQSHIGAIILLIACVVVSKPVFGQLKPVEVNPADEQWVERFIAFMNTGESLEDLLNERRLIRTALRPFQLTPQQLSEFDGVAIDKIMLNTMQQMVAAQSGSFTFLRYRKIDGHRTALFRITSDAGLNYVEWYLETTPDGDSLAWDYNSFSTGELASEALRRMWTPLVAELAPDIKKHMGRRNRELAEHFDEVTGIREAFSEQDFEKALRLYNKLPKSLQENKLTMLLVMTALYQSGDEKGYAEMLDRFAKAHPDASNLELVYLDYYFLREQYGEVLKAVDSLDRRVDGDIYLDLYRANVAYRKGDYEKASRLIDRGLATDRWMEDFYWTAIEHAMMEEDWPRVSKMLSGVESIGIELLDLTEAEGYEGYVATDEYKRWLATRKPAVAE